jgi:ABC-type multidrug transport system fused ATPase/permease subunit
MNADQILVIKDGSVLEQGRHAALAGRAGGLYAKLFTIQTEGARTGELSA